MARLLYALFGFVLLAIVVSTVITTINGPVFIGLGKRIEALVPPRPAGLPSPKRSFGFAQAGETLDDRLVSQKRIMNRHLGTGF